MRIAAVVSLVALVGTGCVSSQLVPCGDDWICPVGSACVDATAVGESRCVSTTCGDGLIGAVEDCDGDDLAGGTCGALGFYDGDLRCNPTTCRFETSSCLGRCGDGVLDPGESCDGSDQITVGCTGLGGRYDMGRPACTAQCTFDVTPCRYFGFVGIYESTSTIAQFCAFEPAPGEVVAHVNQNGTLFRVQNGAGLALAGDVPASIGLACVPDTVLGVGYGIYRHDDTNWSPITLPGVPTDGFHMDASAYGDSLISVGYGGLIVTGAGDGWTVENYGGGDLPALTAGWIDEVTQTGFAAGRDGALLRRSVTGGTATWTDITDLTLGSAAWMWGAGAGDVLIATASTVRRLVGTSWIAQPVSPGPIHGRGPEAMFIGSTDGRLAHHDGQVWSRAVDVTGAFTDLWVASTGAIYASLGVELLRATELWLTLPFSATQVVLAARPAGGSQLWHLTEGNAHRAGVSYPAASLVRKLAVAGDVVFATGAGVLARLDVAGQSGWQTQAVTRIYGDIVAIDAQTAVAVGSTGSGEAAIAVYRSGTWTETTLPASPQLRDVAVTPTGELLVVALGGSILHSTDDAATWTPVDPGFPVTEDLHAIWAAPDGAVHVVGNAGTILRRDPALVWTEVTGPTTRALYAVHGSSATDVIAVGDGMILWFDGVAWTPVRAPLPGLTLSSVAVGPRHIYVAAGTQSYVLYRSP